DLGSTKGSVSASHIKGLTQTTINVGGTRMVVTPSSILTPAENLAVRQVLMTGQQQLLLGPQGNATGGSAVLNRQLSSLIVPGGVTVFANAEKNVLGNLSGTLSNAGNIIAFSNNSQVQTALVSAASIINQQGALISTIAPGALPSGVNPAINKLNLSLNSLSNILNSGTISSAGSLTLQATGSIINALPPGISGASPIIQSLGGLTLSSQVGKITNSGLISSLTSSVNILSAANTLSINNTGGKIEALNATINIRDKGSAIAKLMTDIAGGTLSSGAVNVFSSNGIANLDLQTLNGLLNVDAGEAHINTATGQLQLGSIKLSGDPTFYNKDGDVVINSPLVFAGQNLAIVASGNILTAAGAGAIDSSSATGNGGEINLIAGAKFTTNGPNPVLPPPPGDTTSTLTLQGASSTGGRIDLNSNVPITSLTSESSKANGSGGAINLFAFKGSDPLSGTITIPSSLTIKSGGKGTGNNGSIQIYAGASNTQSISIGGADTTGGKFNSGYISIISTQPLLSGTVHIKDGKLSGTINPGDAYRTGRISVDGSLRSTAGIVVSSKGDVKVVGDIDTSLSGAGTAGGINVFGRALDLHDVRADNHLGAEPGFIYMIADGFFTSGYLSAASDSNKAGGSIALYSNGEKINGVDGTGESINVSSSGGNGGSIYLQDNSARRFDVGTLASNNGTLGSITASGFVNGGAIQLTCCGRLAIFQPASISAIGQTGRPGSISITDCSDKPQKPEIFVLRTSRNTIIRADRQATVTKTDSTRAPTDVTLGAPGSDDPDDIPDIGETNERARLVGEDKLINGAIVRRYIGNTDQLKQFNQFGLITDHSRRDTNFDIAKGNVLFLPEKPLQVGFQNGKLELSPGAAVFVIDKGDDLAILDFHDTGSGSVRVVAGNRLMKLSPGKLLVLTKTDSKNFKDVHPIPKVGFRNPKEHELGDGIKAFVADFSIPSAMISVAPLRNFMKNATGADKQMINKILKDSAIIGDITPTAGPYVNGL
ncbi:MAG: hypothetical protein K2X81_03385, partial [Candidatus Obscuribacterales bacterium]|nr:hypothetical protein [Candidatus Obscuribacterales bacterium]